MPSAVPRAWPEAARAAGISLAIYVVLALLAFAGFVALAVDVGRLHLAKTELQSAADAAARTAAWNLAMGATQADAGQGASDIAQQNTCAGSAVVLDTVGDVQFGQWAADRIPPFISTSTDPHVLVNAAQVTARRPGLNMFFAQIVGFRSANIRALSTAKQTGGVARPGIVGISNVTMSGSARVDSYNSMVAEYNPALRGSQAAVLSNNPFSLSSTVSVYGDAYLGPTVSDSDLAIIQPYVTGAVERMPDPLSYPAVNPADYAVNNDDALKVVGGSYYLKYYKETGSNPSIGDISLSGSDVATLKGADASGSVYTKYLFRNFSLTGGSILTVQGKVDICVTGTFTLSGQVISGGATSPKHPGDFRVRVAGTGSVVTLSGQSVLYADIYAPQRQTTISGSQGFFGSLITDHIEETGGRAIHLDLGIQSGIQTTPSVFLVQ